MKGEVAYFYFLQVMLGCRNMEMIRIENLEMIWRESDETWSNNFSKNKGYVGGRRKDKQHDEVVEEDFVSRLRKEDGVERVEEVVVVLDLWWIVELVFWVGFSLYLENRFRGEKRKNKWWCGFNRWECVRREC